MPDFLSGLDDLLSPDCLLKVRVLQLETHEELDVLLDTRDSL